MRQRSNFRGPSPECAPTRQGESGGGDMEPVQIVVLFRPTNKPVPAPFINSCWAQWASAGTRPVTRPRFGAPVSARPVLGGKSERPRTALDFGTLKRANTAPAPCGQKMEERNVRRFGDLHLRRCRTSSTQTRLLISASARTLAESKCSVANDHAEGFSAMASENAFESLV